MKKLKRFWRTLEEPYGVRGVRAHWRRYLGAELEAISPFLLSLKEPSLTYPCPRIGGDGCPRGVVVHGPEDIVAVCRAHPRECDTIKLSPADIVEYEFDWKRFCGFLSELLGLVSVAEPVRGQRGIWHVGTWAVNATDHRPAFLVASASRALFDGAIGVLLISSQGPFIVLAPTLRFSGGAATDGLRQRGAALLALEDTVLQSNEGTLVAAGTLQELVGAGGSREHAAIGDRGNVFRREQDFWGISFGGKIIHLKDSAGLGYIAELLRAPGKEIEALALVGQPSDGKPQSSVAGPMEMADEKTIRTVRAALQEREKELAGLPKSESAHREKLIEEIDQLKRYLQKNQGFGGRLRKTADTAEKARKAASAAVTRTIAEIQHHHPELAVHLKSSLALGRTLLYRPEKNVEWSF
jgi:hypothetical protein